MTHLQKSRLYPILRWVPFNLPLNSFRSPEYPVFGYNYKCSCYSVHNHYRFFGSVAVNVEENDNNVGPLCSNDGETPRRIKPSVKRQAEGALLDYLHSTRSLPFVVAEHMSKNAPHFIRKLVGNGNVCDEVDVRRSMGRFLSYHPVNEFEPFFESIGLEPSEFVPLLPRNLMFLSDEDGLLHNYHVLCEYGIARDRIGKIFRETREVFRYRNGVLESRLRGFEELGIGRAVVAKAVSFSPFLLIDENSKVFFEMVRRLESLGYEYDWVEQCLVDYSSSKWRQIIELLNVLNDLVCNDEEIGNLIGQHPELLFDHSGRSTFLLFGFLLKHGSTKNDICSMLSQFPQVKVGSFFWNLRRVSDVLCDIEMDSCSIGRIIRTHFTWLGSCSLKQANSLLTNLNTGKKHMCDIIVENPLVLKNWTLRTKVERLPDNMDTRSLREKVKFLSSVGFVESSEKMEKALKAFRGNGEELHERFRCLVNAGLSEDDAVRMIKAAPQILNQSTEILETKISFLVHVLGYPVSSLKPFPGFMSYTIERVKLRCAMCKWLADQGAIRPNLSLSTMIGCTESAFVNKYVHKHSGGLEVWRELKKTICSA